MTKEEINYFMGRIQDADVEAYKKVDVTPSETQTDEEDDFLFTSYKELSYEVQSDKLGVCNIILSKDGELISFEDPGGAEYTQDTPGRLYFFANTDNDDWKESLEEKFTGPDKKINATGYIYPLCGYGDTSKWLGIQPDSDIYDAMDAMSSDSEAIYQIVDKMCFTEDEKEGLYDAIWSAEQAEGADRVVLAFVDIKTKNHDLTVFGRMVDLLDSVFGQKQTIVFWMDHTEKENPENDAYVKQVAATLADKGFELYQAQNAECISNIIIRKDAAVAEFLKNPES